MKTLLWISLTTLLCASCAKRQETTTTTDSMAASTRTAEPVDTFAPPNGAPVLPTPGGTSVTPAPAQPTPTLPQANTPSYPVPPKVIHDTVRVVVPPKRPDTTRKSPPSPSGNIRVSYPQPGATVHADQFQLQGTARTFENVVSYRLRYQDGSILSQGTTMASGPMGTFSRFSTMVSAGKAGKATLEVYENSAKDGSEINKVTIPVTLSVGSND